MSEEALNTPAPGPVDPPPARSLGRFVGVAVGAYRDHDPLSRAVPDTKNIGDLLQDRGLQVSLIEDLPRGELLDRVETEFADGSEAGGNLIVLWTGHGEFGPTGALRLLARGPVKDVEVADGAHLAEWAARTGARQILLLIDACFAGSGLIDATSVAQAVLGERAEPGRSWFAVLAACLGDEPALSGALARELSRLLTDGPSNERTRKVWALYDEHLYGDDLIAALTGEWAEARQQPQAVRIGQSGPLILNPLFQKRARSTVVEHLLLAARGGSGAVGNFFTGRHGPLARLVVHMRAREPGLVIVTGPPGCGKSALVGRVVSLSDSDERARIAKADPAALADPDADPGERSVTAHLHARSLKADAAWNRIAAQIELGDDASKYQVLDRARDARLAGAPLVIVVDGLDEVGSVSDIREFALGFVAPLASEALVVLSTRPIPVTADTPDPLAQLGSPLELIDLGEDPATRSDVREYIERRLHDVSPEMDPSQVAEGFLAVAGDEQSGGLFLHARLVTSQLLERPVNTGDTQWRDRLASSSEAALEQDLSVTPLEIGGRVHPTAARELLRALSCAHGDGFPPDMWAIAATALSLTGTVYERNDLYQALVAVGRHVATAEVDGQAVYRLAHRQLHDHLRPTVGQRVGAALEPAVAATLLSAFEAEWTRRMDSGDRPEDHHYLWHQFWRHAADAGETGIATLRRLDERTGGALQLDLAFALESAADTMLQSGRLEYAAEWLEESAQLFDELHRSDEQRWILMRLAGAQALTGRFDDAMQTVRRAVELFRAVDDDASRVGGAMALVAASVAQRFAGNMHAAAQLAEDSITLLEPDPTDPVTPANEVVAQALASALTQRAVLLCERDPQAALATATRALELADGPDAAPANPIWVDAAAVRAACAVAAHDWDEARSTAQAVVDRFHRSGATGTIVDVAYALSILQLAQIDSRGIAGMELDDALAALAAVDEGVAEAITLLDPLAGELPIAAAQLAQAWCFRASLPGVDRTQLDEGLQTAERQLRLLPDDFVPAGMQLGNVLLRRANLLGDTDQDARRELVDEAVECLASAQAILGGWQLMTEALTAQITINATFTAVHRKARVRLIDLLRNHEGPEVDPWLAAMMGDEIGELANTGRVVEALALESRANAIVDRLDGSRPEVRLLAANVAVNTGAAHMANGDADRARRAWLTAVARLRRDPVPAARPTLALALSNLAASSNERGRPRLAMMYADRAAAVELDQGELSDVPLIRALTQLNHALALLSLGRTDEGADELDTATASLRGLLSTRPWIKSSLAAALNGAGDSAWTSIGEAMRDEPALRIDLFALRSWPRGASDRTVENLVALMAEAQEQELAHSVRSMHEIARFRRNADPEAFDAAWMAATGEVPAWLTMARDQEDLVIAWLNTDTWSESRAYLASTPRLLDADTDVALDELIGEDEAQIARHQHILEAARRDGIDEAYAVLAGVERFRQWIDTGFDRDYFAAHADELRHPAVRDALAEPGRWLPDGMVAFLYLVDNGESDLAFRGLSDDAFVEWAAVLKPAWAADDTRRLWALGTLARFDGSASDDARVVGRWAMAVATALDGDADGALTLFDEADPEVLLPVRDQLLAAGMDALAAHPGAAALGTLVQRLRDIVG